ncbi:MULTISPECIES: hypothetical protein [Pseudoalteromonas]|uniref:hypothetical protein n=1 Tax=Pseudoalteromonas TaxID=53246 RepID=UPI00026CD418|nr:hypothetical protein [Pseudoalteromonas spongiae]ATC98220.1 hypothetical protein PSPO_a1095 [Pseudoalteromonas spongiae UST010723-006]
MTDIQSLLNVVSSATVDTEQSALSQLSPTQQDQVKQLQQLMQQLNLPTKTSQKLLTALLNETLNISNVDISKNKLSFNLPQLTPKLIELIIPNQTIQLQTDKAQVTLSTSLTDLLVSLPKHEIKLPNNVVFQLLKLATNDISAQPTLKLPAHIVNQPNLLAVESQKASITSDLPKNLVSLVKHNQPAIIEIATKQEKFSFSVKLDKHSQPVLTQPLSMKKVIDLIKLQNAPLQLDTAKAPTIKINQNAVQLPLENHLVSNQILKPNLKNLGNKAVLTVPKLEMTIKLVQSDTKQLKAQDFIAAPKPQSHQLPVINQLTSLKASVAKPLLEPIMASIRSLLSGREVTIKHAAQGSINIQVTTTNQNAKADVTLAKFEIKSGTEKLPTSPIQSKAPVQKAPIYARPLVTTPSLKPSASLQVPIVAPNQSAINIKSNHSELTAKLEATAKQNPLSILTQQISKLASEPKLPEPLARLVNQAFTRIISEGTAVPQTVLQLKSVVAPLQNTQTDTLQTPFGAMEHAKISLASNGVLQQATLNHELQGKLENLLPILLGLSKGLTNKKDSKSLKGQLALPALLQKNMTDSLSALQKGLQGNASSTSQQTSSTEQPQVNMQFSIPMQQNEKLATAPISIEEEKRKTKNGELVSVWRINLAFEVENSILNIGAELIKKQLSLSFNSSHTRLIEKAKTQAPLLQQKLTQHGIEVTQSEFHVSEQQSLSTRSGIVNIKV